MIMDNFQLIILMVTIIGSMFAHGKIILSRIAALEDRMSALENRVSALEGRVSALEGRVSSLENRVSALETRVCHMEGLFEGFRAAGLVPSVAAKEPTGTA